MSDLSEFLLARIADEEDLARDAASEGSPPRTGWQIWTSKVYTTPRGEVLGPRGTVEAHPTRVLAECASKRAVIELHRPSGEYEPDSCVLCQWDIDCDAPKHDHQRGSGEFPCPTLRLLALPYADHDDFQPEWKP